MPQILKKKKKKARLGISAGNRNSKAGSNENSKTKKKKNTVPKTMNSMTDSFSIRLDDWKKNSSGLEECSEENTQNEAWVTKGHI